MSTFDGTVACWIPAEPIKRSETHRLRVASFGDGYEQRTLDGVNSLDQKWQVTFENRATSDLMEMRDFLASRKGYSFPFMDPATGELFDVWCNEWDLSWTIRRRGGDYYGTLTAEFIKSNGATQIMAGSVVVTGPAGPKGDTGTRGSKWYVGNGAPAPTITGVLENDMYLDKLTGDVWSYVSGVWLLGET